MDVLVIVNEQEARDRAPEARVDEGDPAHPPDVVTERAHAARLVAAAAERGTERRSDESCHHPERDEGHREREIVERRRPIETDPEWRAPRKPGKALVCLGDCRPARSEEHT